MPFLRKWRIMFTTLRSTTCIIISPGFTRRCALRLRWKPESPTTFGEQKKLQLLWIKMSHYRNSGVCVTISRPEVRQQPCSERGRWAGVAKDDRLVEERGVWLLLA